MTYEITPAEVEALVPYLTPTEAAELELLLADLPDRFDPDQILFGKQRDFVRDPAQLKSATCSRRAGKTVGVAVELLEANREKPDAPCLYFTLTRGSAKRIVWSTLLELNRRYGLGYEPNESELVLKKGGVGRIFLTGADNRSEIEKWRGTAWGKVVGDEAQALPAYLKDAVEDVFLPSFMDYNGSLTLIGTPAPVPVGYFYESSQSKEWSAHHWTFFDNPWIEKKSGKTPQQHLARTLKLRGVTADDPGIQREFFGKWAYDPNALVFRFDKARNLYLTLPACRRPWQHVIGVDLGFDDADAIGVIGFNEERPDSYLREEWVGAKQTITQLAERLSGMVDRYKPISVVMDTGGLGKKIAEEITSRFGLPIKAAEKSRKLEYVELLNDAMRTGRFFVPHESRFARDALLVEWDRDKSKGDRRVVSDRFHSDICDAVLYAYRESLHWLHTPAPEKPVPGSVEWAAAQEDEMEAREEERIAAQLREERGETEGVGNSSDWETGW